MKRKASPVDPESGLAYRKESTFRQNIKKGSQINNLKKQYARYKYQEKDFQKIHLEI